MPERGTDGPRKDAGQQDAAAVIVIHNDGDRLTPLLDALLQETRSVVVVDNASVDGSISAAMDRQGVSVIRNESNRGFAAAANQGAGGAAGEWVLFVNPDVHLEPGQVRALLSGAAEDVAAVAPLQVDEANRPRPETGGYEPSLLRYLVWAVVPVRSNRRWGPWLAPPFPQADASVDWVSGALLGIRRSVFTELGGFDEKYFLYHEDVDFCRRARRAGYRIVCRPSVRVRHSVAHGDPQRRVNSGLRSIESLALDFEGWRRRALGAVLGLGFGLRALLAAGVTRDTARAALPHCLTLLAGGLPTRDLGKR